MIGQNDVSPPLYSTLRGGFAIVDPSVRLFKRPVVGDFLRLSGRWCGRVRGFTPVVHRHAALALEHAHEEIPRIIAAEKGDVGKGGHPVLEQTAAKGISIKRHLPVSYDVGGVKIGPGDFLFAALEVLETNAESVTVVPRDQLGDIAAKLPLLATFRHTDEWIYWPQFKDRYLSDRLRWQLWTLRW